MKSYTFVGRNKICICFWACKLDKTKFIAIYHWKLHKLVSQTEPVAVCQECSEGGHYQKRSFSIVNEETHNSVYSDSLVLTL